LQTILNTGKEEKTQFLDLTINGKNTTFPLTFIEDPQKQTQQ